MHIREKQWLQRQYNRVFASAGQYPRECGFVKKKEKVLIKCKYGDMYDSKGFPKY